MSLPILMTCSSLVLNIRNEGYLELGTETKFYGYDYSISQWIVYCEKHDDIFLAKYCLATKRVPYIIEIDTLYPKIEREQKFYLGKLSKNHLQKKENVVYML